ncbi:MAG: T9SS type A sorting domain-containing protein [Sediminibacterium sp.]
MKLTNLNLVKKNSEKSRTSSTNHPAQNTANSVNLRVYFEKNMNYLLTILFSLLLIQIAAQPFSISSQNCYGAGQSDIPVQEAKLSNGNRLILCSSNSPAGNDKTESCRGDYDFWVVCLDPTNQIIWDKTIGGSNNDQAASILVTADQSIYVAGSTKSPISGEQSNTPFGNWDAWLIKMNSSGTILWDKNYGGQAVDGFNQLLELSSGNILAFGSSSSEVSGNKTSTNFGATDIWCLKITPNGAILNDWSIGGDQIDTRPKVLMEEANKIKLVCSSSSGISGLKTQASFGSYDLWLSEIDTNCQIIRQQTIGGADIDQVSAVIASANGDLLVLAESWSNSSGLKTEDAFGLMDTWLLKLDADFNILNQKTIGGSGQDYGNRLFEFPNGNILVVANSDSPVNTFKNEPNIGQTDIWLYGVAANFNFFFDETIGTAAEDMSVDLNVNQNEFHLLGYSNGAAENDKTCNGYGNLDIWTMNLSTTLEVMLLSQPFRISSSPNPAQNEITITQNTAQNTNIKLLDLNGAIINNWQQSVTSQTYDISGLSNGIFWLQFETDGVLQSEKLVVFH